MPPGKQPIQRQPWLKRVLVPFWVFQLLFMLVLIGLNVWVTVKSDFGTVPASEVLVLSFACVNTAVIIVEIVLFARRRLRPLVYLVFQVFKTMLWMALFVMSMIGVVSIAGKGYLTASVVTYLFSGFIEVTLVLLAFIGTLVYASVIYHRHRHNIPYHRSAQAASSTDNDRYKGPFTDPEIGVARYNNNQPGNRDSASAPEVGTTTMQERWVGELGNESEIREMDTPDEKNVGKRDRGHHRELDGDSWIYELSATGSVRGSHRGQMGELDGATPPKVPEKS